MTAPVSTEREDAALSLTLAVVAASQGPLLLLDEGLNILAASRSFCRAFEIEPALVEGEQIFALGKGEWDAPQLRSLLMETASGAVDIEAYEFDLNRPGRGIRRLSVNAQLLSYLDLDRVRVLVAISDITDTLVDEKAKDQLRREHEVLLNEVRHRVANSLQIVASVLLQSARRTQSDEARGSLQDAHNRVMSVAALERQLSPSSANEVPIRAYLLTLCASIRDSMIGHSDRIKLDVVSDDVVVPADRSVSLGLITTELVINALKHAFPDGRSGKIKVAYAELQGSWSLEVSDDGIGMPPAVKVVAGLGTSIVQALARQLGATVSVHDAEPGVLVSVAHG